MKFEHTVVIDAPRDRVRDFLDDFEEAATCVPGIDEVHEIEPDVWEGRMRLRVGPIGFSIMGQAKLDRAASVEDGWKMRGEGHDRRVGAGVVADLEAHLREIDANTTEMVMDADVQFSGRLAELGQPLIKRKSESMVKEFAENLRKRLAEPA
jgi:uncharacterized protein